VLAKIDGTNFNTHWISVSSGSGMVAKDATSTSLGRVLAINDTNVMVLTSTGYRVSIAFDGSGVGRQAYFTSTNCSGTPYVNTGSTTASSQLWGPVAYYFPNFGWAIPKVSTLDSNNRATSASPGGHGVVFSSIFNISASGCSTAGAAAGQAAVANYTWILESATTTTLGLPATITPPIVIQ
jgi:hypothetical protein